MSETVYGPYFSRTEGRYFVLIDGKKKFYARHLMEQHLGRKLEKWETVHHKNENREDDRIENLEVLHTSRHRRMHMFENKIAVTKSYFDRCSLTEEQIEYCKRIMQTKDVAKILGISKSTVKRVREHLRRENVRNSKK